VVVVVGGWVVLGGVGVVLLVVGVMGWVAALTTGRMPPGLRDLGAAALRYQAQVFAYFFLLTSRYPDSSPVLRGRPPEPAPLPALSAEVIP
jgi:hypothetical protein